MTSPNTGEESEFDFDDTVDAFILKNAAAAPPLAIKREAQSLLQPGDVVADQYRVERLIGRGGMGLVYEATDLILDRRVALKLMRQRRAAKAVDVQVALVTREARAIAKISDNRHIVTLFHVDQHEGRMVLVLELLRGQTLAQKLALGPLLLRDALEVMDQVLAGVAAAHSVGVAHRDIKPANLFLTEDGTVKILDFGLASIADANAPPVAASATGSQSRLGAHSSLAGGTPAYMAPEQWAGKRGDARSDVYTALLVLLECVTGRVQDETRFGKDAQPWLKLRETHPQVPRLMVREIARGLAHDPQQRHADASELRAALADATRGKAFGMWLRSTRLYQRPIATLLVLTVVLVPIVVLVGLVTEQRRDRARADRVMWAKNLTGIWRASGALGQVELSETARGGLKWVGMQDPSVVAPSLTKFRHEGLVHVEVGDALLLRTEVHDTPGWCCGNVMYKEAEVVSANEIHVYRNDYVDVSSGATRGSKPLFKLHRIAP